MLKEFEWKETLEGVNTHWYAGQLSCGGKKIGLVQEDLAGAIFRCSAFAFPDWKISQIVNRTEAKKWVEQTCRTELESLFVLPSQEESERLRSALEKIRALSSPIQSFLNQKEICSIARAALDIGEGK